MCLGICLIPFLISYDFLVEQHPDIVKVVLNWSASFGGTVRPQYLEFQEWVLSGIQERLHRANSDKSHNTPDDVMTRFVERVIEAIVSDV